MARHTLCDLPADRLYLAPSILSADFANLGQAIRECVAARAEVIHIDIMDGHFVPNLSMGPALVGCIRPVTDLPFDTHLMVTHPSRFIEPFAKAGADHLTIHVEVEEDVTAVLQRIRALGCSVGLSVKPGTPASALAPYLHLLDLVLVMTVEPGFSGQSFRADMAPKMREIRAMIAAAGRPIHLEVDGGVAPSTSPVCLDNGCNMLVAASSIFGASSVAAGIAALRQTLPVPPVVAGRA